MTDVLPVSPVDRVALRPVKAPAKRALILICRRCERRVHKDGDAGRRLARRLRKLGRAKFGKGAVRTVFTSCMSLCPRDGLAVAVVHRGPQPAQAASMHIADATRPKAAARQLLDTL